MGGLIDRELPARGPQRAIRSKLLLMVLVPLLVVLVLLFGVLLWGNNAFDRLLITRIQSDLAVANGYFERVLGEVGASAMAAADSRALQDTVAVGHEAALVQQLRRFKAREDLDFINLRKPDGRLVATDHGMATDAAAPPLPLQAAPRDGRSTGSVAVLDAEAFGQLAPALQSRVPVPIVPTRNAAPSSRTREDRAMVVVATAAVRDARGAVLGHVQAGVLLNRNLRFIDHINEIVYPVGSLPYGSRGTATLFLDDVRVSTNVRLFGDDAGQPRHRHPRLAGRARAGARRRPHLARPRLRRLTSGTCRATSRSPMSAASASACSMSASPNDHSRH